MHLTYLGHSCFLVETGNARILIDPFLTGNPAAPIKAEDVSCDAILVDVLRRGLVLPLAEGLAVDAEGFARCRSTVDMDIGMKNFVQNGPRVPAAFLHE